MLQNLNNIQLKILSKLIFRKYYLRELSGEINEIPSTILRNFNLLIKNNIVDSYTEGKNKYFFLPKRLYSYYLIKLAENYRTIQFLEKHRDKIALFTDIFKLSVNCSDVIIFGSFAKSLEKKKSDLDLLINEGKIIKSKISDLGKKYNIEINPKIFKSIDYNNYVIREIIKHHIILKGGNFIYEKIYQNLNA
ncbi:hypothetical protein GF327_06285 [Candidatus Woesearchaeota archaeon]|nr:hypothetical protein [Candidatus Woesearchaeota archaeon]